MKRLTIRYHACREWTWHNLHFWLCKFMQWMPPHERARAVSLTTSGMYLGSAGAMLILPTFAKWFGSASLLKGVGALGLSWLLLWWSVGREIPHRSALYFHFFWFYILTLSWMSAKVNPLISLLLDRCCNINLCSHQMFCSCFMSAGCETLHRSTFSLGYCRFFARVLLHLILCLCHRIHPWTLSCLLFSIFAFVSCRWKSYIVSSSLHLPYHVLRVRPLRKYMA